MEKSKLTIKDVDTGFFTVEHTITGWSDDEFAELCGMRTDEALQWILAELDERKAGLGTAWHNGYGIHRCNINIARRAVIITTGKSCC